MTAIKVHHTEAAVPLNFHLVTSLMAGFIKTSVGFLLITVKPLWK